MEMYKSPCGTDFESIIPPLTYLDLSFNLFSGTIKYYYDLGLYLTYVNLENNNLDSQSLSFLHSHVILGLVPPVINHTVRNSGCDTKDCVYSVAGNRFLENSALFDGQEKHCSFPLIHFSSNRISETFTKDQLVSNSTRYRWYTQLSSMEGLDC